MPMSPDFTPWRGGGGVSLFSAVALTQQGVKGDEGEEREEV